MIGEIPSRGRCSLLGFVFLCEEKNYRHGPETSPDARKSKLSAPSYNKEVAGLDSGRVGFFVQPLTTGSMPFLISSIRV